ncbi:MAG: alanine-glyoxylate transaminase / serine-glyoxylate transaminase / serine-pyruvate transaminase [Solirubrobacteraceae bacterium]|jgi:alanine-glyoxylate transaminase/serine-glyoxylate transaminase/serine-pyruvate transaminase|nr:alanine-glyoxylate transaminase / serine-glyoxylate transaminase / serine-pyruvate transaminase [Solirubrobacteraceae bacterium]
MGSHSGRHFLQIPGPTNVPDRILRAMAAPTIDHRGPAFADLAREVLRGLPEVFRTSGPVVTFPSSGTGAWEAALVNTLSPGDRVLAFETGHFATLWCALAERLGLEVDLVPGDWRHGVDPDVVAERLAADRDHAIRAVTVVHNETSTGVSSRIPEVRAAMDAAGHPALLLVDTISSLASMDYRHDEWGVDVTVGCSQKGLMLPPGLGFNAVSERALHASRSARLPRAYWDWAPVIESNRQGAFPYTPPTNLLLALREALDMLFAEGLANVFARHARHAAATRQAVRAWGLEVLCLDEREHSASLTAVLVPDGHDADEVRRLILERYDMSLGAGLGRLAGRVLRIGHLGDLNDLTLAGTLCGVELGLLGAGVPIARGGVQAALDHLAATDARSGAAVA